MTHTVPVLVERKVPVIVKPSYTVYLERTSGLTFGHIDIHVPWTKNVLSALKGDWKAFRSLHEAPILALHTPGDRKHAKFLATFGFTFLCPYADPDTGTPLEIYKHI